MDMIRMQWLLILTLATSTQGRISCDIPSVSLGQTTILTCHFSKDGGESNQKINVLHYCESDKENPETILFSTLFEGKVEFYTHPDYVLLNKTDKIQVKIPRVTKKHVGRYVCMGMQSESSEECTFTLREPSEVQSAIVSTFSASVQVTNTDRFINQDEEYPLALIIGIIAGIIIVGSVTISAIIFIIVRSKLSTRGAKYKTVGESSNSAVGNHVIYNEINEEDENEIPDKKCEDTSKAEDTIAFQKNFANYDEKEEVHEELTR